jgi:hypothetical protein
MKTELLPKKIDVELPQGFSNFSLALKSLVASRVPEITYWSILESNLSLPEEPPNNLSLFFILENFPPGGSNMTRKGETKIPAESSSHPKALPDPFSFFNAVYSNKPSTKKQGSKNLNLHLQIEKWFLRFVELKDTSAVFTCKKPIKIKYINSRGYFFSR